MVVMHTFLISPWYYMILAWLAWLDFFLFNHLEKTLDNVGIYFSQSGWCWFKWDYFILTQWPLKKKLVQPCDRSFPRRKAMASYYFLIITYNKSIAWCSCLWVCKIISIRKSYLILFYHLKKQLYQLYNTILQFSSISTFIFLLYSLK